MLLGYDVNDRFLLSGLCSCGYADSELIAVRQEFAGEINDLHLFNSAKTAIAFRDRTNLRVAEHAPFGVFGIWRICDS